MYEIELNETLKAFFPCCDVRDPGRHTLDRSSDWSKPCRETRVGPLLHANDYTALT